MRTVRNRLNDGEYNVTLEYPGIYAKCCGKKVVDEDSFCSKCGPRCRVCDE